MRFDCGFEYLILLNSTLATPREDPLGLDSILQSQVKLDLQPIIYANYVLVYNGLLYFAWTDEKVQQFYIACHRLYACVKRIYG